MRGVLGRCLLEAPQAATRLSENDIDLIILAALGDLPVRGTKGKTVGS